MKKLEPNVELIHKLEILAGWVFNTNDKKALPPEYDKLREVLRRINNGSIDLRAMKKYIKEHGANAELWERIGTVARDIDNARTIINKALETTMGTAGTVKAPKAIVNTQLARKDEIQPELDFANLQGNEIELKLDKRSVEEITSPEANFIFDGIYKCLNLDAAGKPILATYIEGDRPEVSYWQIETSYDNFCAIAKIDGDMRGKVKNALFGHKRILQSVMLKVKATQKIVIPTFLHGELAEADRIAMPRILNQGDKLQTIDVVELGLVRIKINALIFEHILEKRGLTLGGYYTRPRNLAHKVDALLRNINIVLQRRAIVAGAPEPKKNRLSAGSSTYTLMVQHAMIQWDTGRENRIAPMELSYKSFIGLQGVAENRNNKPHREQVMLRLHSICGRLCDDGEAFDGCEKIGLCRETITFYPGINPKKKTP